MIRIRVSQLVVLEAVQPRARGTCPQHVEELAEFLTTYPDRDTDPVIVYRDPVTEEFRLSEGFHRVEAYRRADREFIACVIREGDLTACRLNALASNAAHGRGRSAEDKQKVIRETLTLVTEWADKRIADHLLVADKTVAAARVEMVAAGLIADLDYRIGGDGHRLTVKRPSSSEIPTKTGGRPSEPDGVGHTDQSDPAGPASRGSPVAEVSSGAIQVGGSAAGSRTVVLHPTAVTVDVTLNKRVCGIDNEWVEELVTVLDLGGEFDDPPVVFEDPARPGVYLLASGFHRTEAARRYSHGRGKAIPFEVRTGAPRDALRFALGTNGPYEIHHTKKDHLKKIATIMADPEFREMASEDGQITGESLGRFIGVSPAYAGLLLEEWRQNPLRLPASGHGC